MTPTLAQQRMVDEASGWKIEKVHTQRTYVIEQRGSKWVLLTKDHSRVLGTHASRAAAEAQERAIEANKEG